MDAVLCGFAAADSERLGVMGMISGCEEVFPLDETCTSSALRLREVERERRQDWTALRELNGTAESEGEGESEEGTSAELTAVRKKG